ncbi:MAG: adenylosuccinate lyase family protein [Hyphomicrobiaceae bacterium]|nr:adenylosuccinate lyase family protein [Hyphomicrobiaceae bacterium]
MPSTVYDSAIFRDWFSSEAMRTIFSDEALVSRYVDVEVALAKVQGALGLIPADAAKIIAEKSDASSIDLAKLKIETDLVGYPIVGVVHQLQKQCGDAGHYLHWGATTQDIIDTATVLQIRDALANVESNLIEIAANCAHLADTHRSTVMAGRTHLQQALPTTFGLKAAVWLSMLDRHRARLVEAKPRILLGQFGGAAGTLASLGPNGLAVHDALVKQLGLNASPVPWHVARDGIAEAVNLLSLITGTLAKIATDVMLMMQTEVGEVYEPFMPGRGGSSTMPQKRNPISSEFIFAAARAVRQDAGLVLDSLAGADHERATGPWQLEWIAVPRAFLSTGAALEHAKYLTGGLIVEPTRMRKNLDSTNGLIVAEAVMMAVAEKIGRGPAHDCVYAACRKAIENGTLLIDELRKEPKVTAVLDDAALQRLTDPANYLGSADAMISRALAARAS